MMNTRVLSRVMRKLNSVTYEVGKAKAEQAAGMFGLAAGQRAASCPSRVAKPLAKPLTGGWRSASYARSQQSAPCFFPIHLFQRFHTHIALYAPLSAGDVSQPCADQHQRRFSIREGSNHPRAPANFAVQTLQHVVGSNFQPVLGGESIIRQGFLNAILHLFRRFLQDKVQ